MAQTLGPARQYNSLRKLAHCNVAETVPGAGNPAIAAVDLKGDHSLPCIDRQVIGGISPVSNLDAVQPDLNVRNIALDAGA